MLNNGRILVCDSNNQCVQVIIIAVDYVKRDRDCQLAWKLFFFADWSISTIRCSVRPVPCFQDGEFEVEVLGNFRDPLALLSWRSLMVVVVAIAGNKQTKRPSHQANCLTQDGNIAVSDYDNKWISIHEPNGKFVSKVIFRLDLSSENPKMKYFFRFELRKSTAKIFSPIVGREQASWSKGHRSRRVRRTNCDRQQGLCCLYPPSSFRKGRLHSVWNISSLQKKLFKVLTKFGSRGSDGPQFAGPHYVATNSHGNIVISDFHNHNIKIFTKEGAFIFSFGTNGEIAADQNASQDWIWF